MARSATAGALSGSRAPDDYARRLGALLRRRRRRRHRSVSVRRLAATAGRGLSAADLRAYERGERPVDPAVLGRLCDVYGIEVESVLPDQRAVIIDLERRQLSVGGDTFALPASADPSSHLQRYVRAVNRLRSRPMRSPATLRRDDTEALAEALELDADEVAALLADVIGQDAADRRRATALKSGAGTLAAVVVIGAAAPAVQSRHSQGDAIVLTAEEIAPAGPGSAGDAVSAAPVAVPASDTVRGPDLVPDHPQTLQGGGPDGGGVPDDPGGSSQSASGGGSDDVSGDPPSQAPSERGRSADAPASDKRADDDEGDGAVEDETAIGDALTIEREDHEADSQGQAEDETSVDAQGEHLIEATPEDIED